MFTVLAAGKSSLKKWREFRRSCKHKASRTFLALSIFPGKRSTSLTSPMKCWYIVFTETNFFRTKINLKTVSRTLYFPTYTRNFGAHFTHKHLYILQATHCIYNQESHKVGRGRLVFLTLNCQRNSRFPK